MRLSLPLTPVAPIRPSFKGSTSQESFLASNPDLLVSSHKPLGNCAIQFMLDYYGENWLAGALTEAQQKGWEAQVLHNPDNVYPDVFYIYDPVALQNLLNQHLPTLQQVNWPQTANEFVTKLEFHSAPPATPLFDLIADAFADKRNPMRSENCSPATVRNMLHHYETTEYAWYPKPLMAELKAQYGISDSI